MNKEKLHKEAINDLSYILDQKGEVIYSSHKTIKKGNIYLLGHNPGVTKYCSHQILNAENGDRTIRAHLKNLTTKTHNSYIDENWSTENKTFEIGEAPLQKRIDSLLKDLGYNTEDVCASNLIFVTSENSDEIDYGLAGYCWRFHEKVINIVQPKVIICFGVSSQSPFNFLKSILNVNEFKKKESQHGTWMIKYFQTKLLGRDTLIIGLPHLSYYHISNKHEVIEWLKKKISTPD